MMLFMHWKISKTVTYFFRHWTCCLWTSINILWILYFSSRLFYSWTFYINLYCKHPISNLMHDLFNRTVLVNVLNVSEETSFVTLTTIEYLLQDFCCQTFPLELNKRFFSLSTKVVESTFPFPTSCKEYSVSTWRHGGHIGFPKQ